MFENIHRRIQALDTHFSEVKEPVHDYLSANLQRSWTRLFPGVEFQLDLCKPWYLFFTILLRWINEWKERRSVNEFYITFWYHMDTEDKREIRAAINEYDLGKLQRLLENMVSKNVWHIFQGNLENYQAELKETWDGDEGKLANCVINFLCHFSTPEHNFKQVLLPYMENQTFRNCCTALFTNVQNLDMKSINYSSTHDWAHTEISFTRHFYSNIADFCEQVSSYQKWIRVFRKP